MNPVHILVEFKDGILDGNFRWTWLLRHKQQDDIHDAKKSSKARPNCFEGFLIFFSNISEVFEYI